MESTFRSIGTGPWRIDITARPGMPRIVPYRHLARVTGLALEAARAPGPASLGIVLSDDGELAELNTTHMGAAGPTDVLSFPLLPPEAFPVHPGRPARRDRAGAGAFVLPPRGRPHLGDVVVSLERAIEQAVEGRGGHTGDVRLSPADELRLLVVHGTLHVCGWDHAEPEEEAAMRALERHILSG